MKNKATIRVTLRDIFYTQAMEGFTEFKQPPNILNSNVTKGYVLSVLRIVLAKHLDLPSKDRVVEQEMR